MSDPIRWKDGGGPAGMGDLLRSAERPRPMTVAEKARTAARLAKLVPPGGAGAGGVGAGGAIGGAVWGKGLSLLALACAAGAIARTAQPTWELPPSSPAASAEAPIASGAAPGASDNASVYNHAPSDAPTASALELGPEPAASTGPTTEPAEPSNEVVHSLSTPQKKAHPATAKGPKASEPSRASTDKNPLLEEAELVDLARAKLGSEPLSSLSLLQTHARRFPGGQLATEREYLMIDALLRLGRTDEARARAQAFSARHPNHPYGQALSKKIPQRSQ